MLFEILKAIVFGIVEGITEWLPVSSTGHLILLNEFLTLNVSDAFQEMFDVVIQLGAIGAVLVLFFHKLNPFSLRKTTAEKKDTWLLWAKVVVAVVPSAVLGLAFDDWFDAHFYNYTVVAMMLILYGVAFLWVEEKFNAPGNSLVKDVQDISWRTALAIGAFQCLALIPGTSRSGATILGGILLGVSRSAASEFSFFLAIPTMLGASGLKTLKFLLSGNSATATELAVLATGMIVSFLVSVIAIRALMEYVRRHKFSAFGIYRIVLGALVLLFAVLR